MRMRTVLKKSIVAPALVAIMALSGCGADDGLEDFKLMVDVAYLPKHAPFFSTVAQGFFKEEGLDVELMPGSGSTNTVTSVETGRVDAGWADFGATILSQGKGAHVKQVNLLQAQSAYATVALKSSGINDWEDMKGKTVATEGAGAMTAMWPLALERSGLKEDDVSVVHATGESKIPGLLAGRWDANLALFVSDQPALMALGEDASILKWSDVGISLYGNGIVMSEESLTNETDRVKRFNRAMQRGFLYSCAHPEQAADDFMKEVQGYEQETVTFAIAAQCELNWATEESDEEYGLMSDEGVQQMLTVATDFLGLEDSSKLSVADIYSNDYVDPIRRDEEVSAPSKETERS